VRRGKELPSGRNNLRFGQVGSGMVRCDEVLCGKARFGGQPLLSG